MTDAQSEIAREIEQAAVCVCDKMPTDLERADQLFSLLQGFVPDRCTVPDCDVPHLTPEQAWTVIWWLGNQYWQVPDTIERCDLCGELYDERSEGECFDFGTRTFHVCGECGDTHEATDLRRFGRRLEEAKARQRRKTAKSNKPPADVCSLCERHEVWDKYDVVED